MIRFVWRAAAAVCFLTMSGLGASPSIAREAQQDSSAKRVEVVFVLDTTGSMGSLIEGAKRKIWSIATSIVDQNPEAEVHMGLVAYRDRGDDFVTKTYPLTRDIQKLYGELLAFEADGGGDWPEAVNEALDTAVTKIQWSHGAKTDRIAFLVGDAPPQMKYKNDRKYPDVMKTAREHGIIVNAVQAGDAADTERVWRSVAQLGGGRYIPIPQDGGKVVVIETPYDREILELQIEINRTVMPYGSRRQKAEVQNKAMAASRAPVSVATDMSAYMQKSGKGAKAVTGDGDIVGEVMAGTQRLEALRDEDRPDELRGLDVAEQKKRVEAQAQKRKDLSGKMEELVKKRDAFISEAQAKAGPKADSFDEVVKETLRSQIKS